MNNIYRSFLLFLFIVSPCVAGAQLSGNYTINPAGLPAPPNYTSFGAAVAALNTQGVSSPVVFMVAPGTYTETITITDIPGTGPGSTVTFESSTGPDNCIISFDAPAGGIAQGTVNLRGAKYVSFKGITIQNFQTATNSALHIFAGDGSGTYDVRAEYLSFENCRFIVDTTATSARFGVFIANNSSWSGYTRPTLAHKLSFSKCLFKGGTVGVGVLPSGTSSWYGSPVDSISLDSCEAVLQYSFGAEFWGCKNVSVTNSYFHRMRTGNGTASALRLFQSLEFNVRNNHIICGHRIGLEVNHNGSPSLGVSYVVNNYISGNAGGCGYLSGSKNVKYYHNTFKSTLANGVGVDFNGTISDNEFVNNIVEAGTVANVNVFNSPGTAGGFTAIDYNVYYGANGGAARFYWGTNYTGLAAWQAAVPAFNVNSVFAATVLAPGGPEITDPNTARPGTNLGVPADIFGRSRSTTPTIGAYEYTSLPVPPQPGPFIIKTDTVCNPPVSTVRYTINMVSNATGYEWTYTGGTGVSINGGGSSYTGNVNDTSVTIDFNAGAVSGTLSVRAVNAAGSGTARTMPVIIQITPGTPGAFTASKSPVCQGEAGVAYTVPAVTGMNYAWSHTGGSSVTINGGGNSVTTDFGTSAPAVVTIQVTASNKCGTSATPRSMVVTVTPLPSVPVAFTTSSNEVCAGTTGVVYTVPNVSGITYAWNYSGAGATINGTGNSVTVDYGISASGGTLGVTATNSCGTSAARTMAVTVNQIPSVTVARTTPADVCAGDTSTLIAGGSGTTYTWKNASGAAVHSGSVYHATVTGTYYVVSQTSQGCRDSSALYDVHIHDRPDVHIVIPTGDTAFCEGGIAMLRAIPEDTGLHYRWKNGNDDIPNAPAYFLERTTSGIYSVVVTRLHVQNCMDSSAPVTVTVYPLPSPVISRSGDTLFTAAGYDHYQWYTGGQPVPGATERVYLPVAVGAYSVAVTDSNGCSNTSASLNVDHVGVRSGTILSEGVHFYPNPSSGMVYITSAEPVDIQLNGLDGRILIRRAGIREFDVQDLPDGIYLLRIVTPQGRILKYERLVKSGRH